jgi:hypothetical protein
MATTTARPSPEALARPLARPIGAIAAIGSLVAISLLIAIEMPTGSPAAALVAAIVLAIACWMLVSERYEVSLAVLMVYIGLADGFLKLKSGSDNVTLVRDLMLWAIAAGALVRGIVRGQRFELPPLGGWVAVWVVVVLIQVFNPNAGTLYHSLASLRQHIEWVPLFFLGYLVMRTRTRIRRFLLLLVAIAALNGVVGLVQFNLTPEQLANWGPGYAKAINGEGDVAGRTFQDSEGNERPRPFGLGGDSSFGGLIALIATGGAIALLSLSRRGGIRALTIVLAGWVAIAIATSDARVAVLGSIIGVLAFAGMTVTSRAGMRTVLGIAGVVLVTGIAISALSSSSSNGSFDRYTTISNPVKAVGTAFSYKQDSWELVPTYASRYPLGAGIGSGGPAAAFPGASPVHGHLNAEIEPTFLLIEVGIPGLIVIAGFELALLALCVRRIRRIADRELRILLTGLAAPLFALLSTWIVGVSTATTPAAPYLWLTAGALSYWLLGPGWRKAQEAAPPRLPGRLPAAALQPHHG